LAKTFLTPRDEVVVSASCFVQYKLAAQLMGANVITVPMQGLKLHLAGMAAAVTEKTKFVFIANPNNPTGTYNTVEEVNEFLALLPAHVLPVFDEAYFEYAAVNTNYPTMIEDYYKKRPMVVLRTFSKIYGLAGLRVGYGIAPEACVTEMDKIRPPFNVSVPAQAAALAAMQDLSHVEKSVEMNEKEKKVLAAELEKMGFEAVPSAANFILFRVMPYKGRALFEDLIHKAIITRSVDEYGLPDYLRVTIGDKGQNKEFLKALREVLGKK
jgi:histidinol-phosphate aminotransferase